MRRHRSFVLGATLALGLGAGLLVPRLWSADPVKPSATLKPEARAALTNLKQLSDGFAAVSEMVVPSVVTVTSERLVQPTDGPMSFLNDPFFRRFFGDQAPPQEDNGRSYRSQGLGSGVIVGEDGKILTNNHVVRGADELTVILSDGRRLKAKVVGADARTDLAVLQVDAKGLPAMPFGDSDGLRIGEWVIAIGSPFSENLRETVSAGIVSGLSRSGMNLNDYEDFIQTDAAINPGNSGGALVNLDGELIGINSAIATRGGGFSGIGFAIPANMARDVMNDLISDGKVTRGWLGVQIQDVNENLAEAMGLDRTEGVLVNSVVAEGPAAEAGLRQGDVIASFSGKTVKDVRELRMAVAREKPGTQHPLGVARDGREMTLDIKLGTFPEDGETVAEDGNSTNREDLGITVEAITPENARRLEIEYTSGMVVTAVAPGSPAEDAGVRPGDLVREVNRTKVGSLREYREALGKSSSGKPVLLLLERGGNTFFVALKGDK